MRQSTGNFLALSWFFFFPSCFSKLHFANTPVLIGSLYYLLCWKLYHYVPLSMEPRTASFPCRSDHAPDPNRIKAYKKGSPKAALYRSVYPRSGTDLEREACGEGPPYARNMPGALQQGRP